MPWGSAASSPAETTSGCWTITSSVCASNFTESISVNVTCMQCFSTYTYILSTLKAQKTRHTLYQYPSQLFLSSCSAKSAYWWNMSVCNSSIHPVSYIHAPCAAQLRAHAGFTHRRNMDYGTQRVWDHYHQQWLSWLGFLDLCACLSAEIYSSKTLEPKLAQTNAPNKSL